MKIKLLILAVAVVASLSGCSNDERVALGAIAGASGGALASDTHNKYFDRQTNYYRYPSTYYRPYTGYYRVPRY